MSEDRDPTRAPQTGTGETTKPETNVLATPARPAAPASSTEATTLDLLRVYLGRETVAMALLVVLGSFVIAVVAFRDAAAVATAMGTVTTLIGTLVGTYFGVQVGSQGRAQDAAARDTATETAVRAAAFVQPADAHAFNAALDKVYGSSTANGNQEFN